MFNIMAHHTGNEVKKMTTIKWKFARKAEEFVNNISEAGYPIVNGMVMDEFDLADLENKERK